jgi:hypothetical protein
MGLFGKQSPDQAAAAQQGLTNAEFTKATNYINQQNEELRAALDKMGGQNNPFFNAGAQMPKPQFLAPGQDAAIFGPGGVTGAPGGGAAGTSGTSSMANKPSGSGQGAIPGLASTQYSGIQGTPAPRPISPGTTSGFGGGPNPRPVGGGGVSSLGNKPGGGRGQAGSPGGGQEVRTALA